MLFAAKIERCNKFSGVMVRREATKLTELQAHQKLGHMLKARTQLIADSLGWTITKKMGICVSCAEAKARQRNIATNYKTMKVDKAGDSGSIHLDMSSIKIDKSLELETALKPKWLIIVDKKTQLKFSEFFTSKSDMINPTFEKLTDWIRLGKNIKIIRRDNAGENKALEKKLKGPDWKSSIAFEYTGRDTPQ